MGSAPERSSRQVVAVAAWLLSACASAPRQAPADAAPAPDVGARERPIPYPVFETVDFRRAVERGTRTRTGRPGPRHWTQYAQYAIQATLDPAAKRLTGRETIRYENRSPDTLTRVVVHLRQNLFAPGAARNGPVPETRGMELSRVEAQGQTLGAAASITSNPGYVVDGTVMTIRLPRPLPPNATADFGFDWAFTVPPDGAPREGTDGEVFMIAYWYPQIAVYDDVNGWAADQYLGNAEFYMGYADYDVSLTVPAGWLIGGTGELVNGDEVLSARTRARLADAKRAGAVVHVVAETERGVAGGATAGQGRSSLTWRWRARNVRDFAFGASDQYLWDATVAAVGDRDGNASADTALVHSFYRPSRIPWAWDQSNRYAKHAIEFLSRHLWPYPYPQMTALDGVVSCTGMEYPMITCIGGQRDTLSLYSVTVHEFAHMWFPMQVGSNETRHAWQDEGLTRFNQAQSMREFFRGYDLERTVRGAYLALARSGDEVELMRHGDLYPASTAAYSVASYQKMATILVMLRAVLGEETFLRAYREYGQRWLGRHPTPYDFFNTFNDVAGRDLSWFWRTWFYETWTLDQAIAGVRAAGDSVEIVVADRGLAPMPARLTITRQGGRVERVEIPVDVWLRGQRRASVRVARTPDVVRVELDAEDVMADIDRSNNRWTK
jgi:peptidase M1-like protein